MNAVTILGRLRDRKMRKELRELQYHAGIIPTRPSHCYRVHCSVIEIPDWARANVVRDFSQGERYVWMAHRQKAKMLADMDQKAGGAGELLKVEMRRCKLCDAVYLDAEARARRLVEESMPWGRSIPCGPECRVKTNAKRSKREGWAK